MYLARFFLHFRTNVNIGNASGGFGILFIDVVVVVVYFSSILTMSHYVSVTIHIAGLYATP